MKTFDYFFWMQYGGYAVEVLTRSRNILLLFKRLVVFLSRWSHLYSKHNYPAPILPTEKLTSTNAHPHINRT